MKSGLYGLWVVPKNRIIFLLNNSLLPLLPEVRLLLSKKFDFLGLPTRPYRPDFILEHLYSVTLLQQKCMRIDLQKQNFRDSLNFLVSWITRRCSRLYPNFKLRTSGTGACGQPKIKWSTISHCILNFQFFHFYWHHDMFVRLKFHSINYSYLFQSSKLSEWNE